MAAADEMRDELPEDCVMYQSHGELTEESRPRETSFTGLDGSILAT